RLSPRPTPRGGGPRQNNPTWRLAYEPAGTFTKPWRKAVPYGVRTGQHDSRTRLWPVARNGSPAGGIATPARSTLLSLTSTAGSPSISPPVTISVDASATIPA